MSFTGGNSSSTSANETNSRTNAESYALSCGLAAYSLTISSGTVNATSGKANNVTANETPYNGSIAVSCDTLSMTGGTLNATAGQSAKANSYGVYVHSGTTTSGIYAGTANITIGDEDNAANCYNAIGVYCNNTFNVGDQSSSSAATVKISSYRASSSVRGFKANNSNTGLVMNSGKFTFIDMASSLTNTIAVDVDMFTQNDGTFISSSSAGYALTASTATFSSGCDNFTGTTTQSGTNYCVLCSSITLGSDASITNGAKNDTGITSTNSSSPTTIKFGSSELILDNSTDKSGTN